MYQGQYTVAPVSAAINGDGQMLSSYNQQYLDFSAQDNYHSQDSKQNPLLIVIKPVQKQPVQQECFQDVHSASKRVADFINLKQAFDNDSEYYPCTHFDSQQMDNDIENSPSYSEQITDFMTHVSEVFDFAEPQIALDLNLVQTTSQQNSNYQLQGIRESVQKCNTAVQPQIQQLQLNVSDNMDTYSQSVPFVDDLLIEQQSKTSSNNQCFTMVESQRYQESSSSFIQSSDSIQVEDNDEQDPDVQTSGSCNKRTISMRQLLKQKQAKKLQKPQKKEIFKVRKNKNLYEEIQADEQQEDRFNFFFRRTCHRYLGQYYQVAFRDYLAKNKFKFELKNVPNKAFIDKYMRGFAKSHFKNEWTAMSEMNKKILINHLICHIYNNRAPGCGSGSAAEQEQRDQFIIETLEQLEKEGDGEAFKRAWLVKYRYSVANEQAFFASPIDCFLFHHFASAEDLDAFLLSQCKKIRCDIKLTKSQVEQGKYVSDKLSKRKEMLEQMKDRAASNINWQRK